MTDMEIKTQKSYRCKNISEVSFINKLVDIKTGILVKPVGKLAPLSIIRLPQLLKQNLGKKKNCINTHLYPFIRGRK